MKKIYIALAVGTTVFALASCSKQPLSPQEPNSQAHEKAHSVSLVFSSSLLDGPIVGAVVELHDVNFDSMSFVDTTDVDGAIVVENVPAGIYRLAISFPDHLPLDTGLVVSDSGCSAQFTLSGIPFRVLSTTTLPCNRIEALGSGPSGLWVGMDLGSGRSAIALMDPKTLLKLKYFEVDFWVNGIAEEGSYVWTSSDEAQDHLRKLDLSANPPTVAEIIDYPYYYSGGLCFSNGHLWSTSSSGGGASNWAGLHRHSATSAAIIEETFSGPTDFPHSITRKGDDFWVACSYPAGYHRIDPSTMNSVDVYVPPFSSEAPSSLTGQLAWSAGSFWGCRYGSNELIQMSDKW